MSKSTKNNNLKTVLKNKETAIDELDNFSSKEIALALIDFMAVIMAPGNRKADVWQEYVEIKKQETVQQRAPGVKAKKVTIENIISSLNSLDKIYILNYFVMKELIEAKNYKILALYQSFFIDKFLFTAIQKDFMEQQKFYLSGSKEAAMLLSFDFLTRYCQSLDHINEKNGTTDREGREGVNDNKISNILGEAEKAILSKRQEEVINLNLLGDYWKTLQILINKKEFSLFQNLINNDNLFYQAARLEGVQKINSEMNSLKPLTFCLEELLDAKQGRDKKLNNNTLTDETIIFDVYSRVLEFAYVENPNSLAPLLVLKQFLQTYNNPEKNTQRIEALLKKLNYLERAPISLEENINYLLSSYHNDFPGSHPQNIQAAALLMIKKEYDFDFNSFLNFQKLNFIAIERKKQLNSIFMNLANKHLSLLGQMDKKNSENIRHIYSDLEHKIVQCLLICEHLAPQEINKKYNGCQTPEDKTLFDSINPQALRLISLMGLSFGANKASQDDKNKILLLIKLEPGITARYEKIKLDFSFENQAIELEATKTANAVNKI